MAFRIGASESASGIGLPGLGGLAERSNRSGSALLTDERLWRRGLLRDCLNLLRLSRLQGSRAVLHDRHHGDVTTAGTARGRVASRDLNAARHPFGCL